MAAAPLIIGLVAAAGSAVQKQETAKDQQAQAEIAAKQQELQVVQREADRKDRLAAALSTLSARAGAGGISAFSGSPLTILQDSIERERVGTERDVFQTSLTTLAVRSTARARRRSAQQSAGLSLLQSFGSAAGSVRG